MGKADQHARKHWGKAYDAIPKSVFATVAWHLANFASDGGNAEARFVEELKAMLDNGIIDERQTKPAIKAILALEPA